MFESNINQAVQCRLRPRPEIFRDRLNALKYNNFRPLTGRTAHKNSHTMFAVRRALSDPNATAEIINDLISTCQIGPPTLNTDNPLNFLLEPGANVTHTGTSSLPESHHRTVGAQETTSGMACGKTNIEGFFGVVLTARGY